MRPPVRLTTLVAALLLAFAAAPCLHAAPWCAAEALPGQSLAHPIVTGAAGPFPHVTLALTRPAKTPEAPVTGTLTVGQGTCLALAGPHLPADFFLIDVKAVLFTRLGRERATASSSFMTAARSGQAMAPTMKPSSTASAPAR